MMKMKNKAENKTTQTNQDQQKANGAKKGQVSKKSNRPKKQTRSETDRKHNNQLHIRSSCSKQHNT